jgi:glutamate racemase
MNNKKIGVFDSGVGGLTVALEVLKQLPNEEVVYFGDTARNPYGVRSKEEITDFSRQIIRFLLTKDVKAVVIACNTATVAALESVQKEFDIPIFGVVGPGAESAVNTTSNKKIGIIATEATIKSKCYDKLITGIDSDIKTFSKGCPLLVTIAEECLYDSAISYEAAKYYVQDLLNENIDTLVLGCTHFPLHRKNIEKVVGEGVKIVDPALKTVEVLSDYLRENNMESQGKEELNHEFYVSGNTDKFAKICNNVLNGEYAVDKIDIDKY